MRILHMLAQGDAGGIESLCADIAKYSKDDENHFYFFWGGGQNAEKIKKYTSNVTVRNFENKNVFKEYRLFSNYVLTNKIECIIIQGMSPIMSIFFGLFLRSHKNVKGCLYLHANSEDLFPEKWRKRIFKWSYQYADGCIAISQYVKQSMKGICELEKIQVIYNGTDCQRFALPKKKERHDVVNLLYIGRLIKRKNLYLLLDALGQLDLPFKLNIVGSGSEEKGLKNRAHELELDEKVNFVGTQWNIEKWLLDADIFVHPANREGFGITVIEAMAAETPCVAFDIGAIPEIITNNVDGYLADEITVQSYLERLKFAILQWSMEPEKFYEVSRRAKERAECFDIHRYVNELSCYLSKLEREGF